VLLEELSHVLLVLQLLHLLVHLSVLVLSYLLLLELICQVLLVFLLRLRLLPVQHLLVLRALDHLHLYLQIFFSLLSPHLFNSPLLFFERSMLFLLKHGLLLRSAVYLR